MSKRSRQRSTPGQPRVATSASTEILSNHEISSGGDDFRPSSSDSKPTSKSFHEVVHSASRHGKELGKTEKKVLGDILPDKPNSRASTRGGEECRLDTNFATKFVYDLDGIVVPQKLLYKDYLAQSPATTVDLRGWIVNKGLFKQIEHNCKPVLQALLLEDAIGVAPQNLELIRGSRRLRILNLKNTNMVLTFQAAQILGSLSQLIELDISSCSVDITSFTILCNTCQALQTLTCQACPGLDDFCLQALAACMQRFRRLKCIDLSRGIDYSDEGYLSVLGATPKLITRLNMSNTKILSSLAITALRQKMPALTHLDMSEMKLSQTCFEWITEGCNHLRTLILTRCENLDDIAITRFGTKLLYLEKIVLNHCAKLTDKGVCGFFDCLAESLDLQLGSGLRQIDLSSNIHLGGPPIQSLANYEFKAQQINGKGIAELKLNGLSMVTAPALMSMWKACVSIKKFSMAVELSSTVTHRKSMMPHISDQILIEAQYQSLEEVNLSGCSLVSDTGVCSLIEKCHAQLRVVDISYCNNVTDMTVYHLAQYCGETLVSLNIGGCNKVTNHGMIALCTDHSDKRRKRKLISSVLSGTGADTDTAEKYQAYCKKTGSYEHDDEDEDEESNFTENTPVSHSSSRKVNPSLDKLNPFYNSAGCLKLTKLELNGCYKVTDPGVVAICNLKLLHTLSIRNLDNVTDSPLLLLADSCTKLKSLEMSGLDMVSIDVVKALAQKCYKLETLNCDLCNFTSGNFSEVIRPRLPLGMPNGLRSKLDPRPRPILEYNRFVVETLDKRTAAWVISKFGVYCIAWGRQRRTKMARKRARETIRNAFLEYFNRHRLYHLWGTKNKKTRCANIIQRWAKACLGTKVQGWKARQIWKRTKAAALIERVFRGHKARKRSRNKFRRLFIYYNKIGHLVHKYWVLVHARAFHAKLIQVQSIGRMFPPKLTYILTRRGFITFQIKIRNFLKRRLAVRRTMKTILDTLDGEEVAANVIRKNWRIRSFNKQMSTFTFICAIYWRTLDDEKDWRLVQLQSWFRGQIVRNRNWWIREAPRILDRKVIRVQALWHRYVARCFFVPYRAKLKHHMQCWRKWTKSCCRMRLGALTRRIQKVYKLRYFNLCRLYAVMRISRYYRGYCVRKDLAAMHYEIQSKYARRIQRQCKLRLGRRRRKEMMAIRHMAAWRIQAQIHSLFDGEAKKRIQAKQAVRRRKEILEEKANLLLVVRRRCLERRKAEFMNIFARRIQKRFRKHSMNKRKRAEAKLNKAKATEDAKEEIHQIKAGRFLAEMMKPFEGITSAISDTFETLIKGKGEEVTPADEPRLTNAILKYHTRSIVQLGLTNVHLTVGEGELKSFALAQEMCRTSGKPYYKKIDVDISGIARIACYIWVMYGKGVDCVTQLKVIKRPPETSLAQMRSRATSALYNFKKLVWHQHLEFELHAEQTIKAGKGGFAITDLKIVLDQDDGDDLEVQGYTKTANLEEFGFPALIYIYSKVPQNQDDIFKLGMLAKTDWVDARLTRLIYTYNLANSDVYGLRRVYEGIIGQQIVESVRVKDVFDYLGIEENTLTRWMVDSIKPKRKGELNFSEYAHMAVAFSMFGTKELQRFLFGCMDSQDLAYLKREQFAELIEIMTAGNQNPTVWVLQYDKYKDKKLDSLFFRGFCDFCGDYRAVMWGPEQILQKVREHNLGEALWRDKMTHFVKQRKELGVMLV